MRPLQGGFPRRWNSDLGKLCALTPCASNIALAASVLSSGLSECRPEGGGGGFRSLWPVTSRRKESKMACLLSTIARPRRTTSCGGLARTWSNQKLFLCRICQENGMHTRQHITTHGKMSASKYADRGVRRWHVRLLRIC